VLTVHVLGPVEVRRDGEPVELGGPQQRAVIAHLALDLGRVVSVERLIDRLWGDEPPRTPLGTVQSYVSRLRRAIEPGRGAGSAPQILVSEAPGYLLQLAPEQIDVFRFRGLVAEAREATAGGDHTTALQRLDDALSLWRGPALAGVGPEDQVRPVVVRLDEERESAVEDRFEAMLALGRHAEAVPRLQSAIDDQPLRERLWALLALALYRSSRQADALRTVSTARAMLLDELGLDPGPELRELENRILAQDSTLLLSTHSAAAPVTVAPDRQATPETELVGRADEWRMLTRALDAAGAGQPQLALIEGEPGIGKSTLCDALVAHAAANGWFTSIGRCVEEGLAPSLWPCIEIVRSILGNGDTETPDAPGGALRRLIAGGAESGISLAPVEMADQFITLIDELAIEKWVILLDDLHWADRASLDMIRLVLERVGSRRLMVVCAHRPPEIVPGSLLGEALGGLHRTPVVVTRVRMSPLDAAGVARLMEITAGAIPSPEVADRVQARTGGNPLFVTELARLAGERGLTDDSVVPDAIRDVVRGRLVQLPERATAELEVAAVLGERFDLRTVMAASERDPDDCLDALDAAIVTRILVPESGGFRFAHALVRDAVLAEVSPLRLSRLHHRAAEAILATRGEGPDEAEPLAYHRLGAVAITDPLIVAKAAVRASDLARWRSSLDAANRLAEQALDVLTGVPRTPEASAIEVEAIEGIVAAAYRRSDPAELARVTTLVDEHADRTGSDGARALSLFLHWGDVDETENLDEVAAEVERARELALRTSVPYAIVLTRYMLAAYTMLLGRFDEAAGHAELSIHASGTTDPDTRPEHVPLVLAPVVAGMIAAMRGEAEAARVHTHRRTSAWLSQRIEADPTARPALAFNRALIEAMLGHPEGVLGELSDAPHTDEGGFVAEQTATCEVLAGWAAIKLGRAVSIEESLAAMARIDGASDRILRSCLRTFIADACLSLGDERAVDLLDQARREAESRGEVWWLSETLRLRAEADLRFGDGSRADELFEAAETLASAQGARLVLTRIGATRAVR
jgi:DNA-binding SARP family transcriptional activator